MTGTLTSPDAYRRPLYTLVEAARFARVDIRSARRWLEGYEYRRGGRTIQSPPKMSDISRMEDVVVLSFQDLIELRVVGALRRAKVPWSAVTAVERFLREQWQSPHPLALERLRADGRAVFAEIAGQVKDTHLLRLGTDQFAFNAVVSPSLFDVVDFRDGIPERLWIAGRERPIVIDPLRAFGRPVLMKSGVAVDTVVDFYGANDNRVDVVVRGLEIDRSEVEAALAFDAQQRVAA